MSINGKATFKVTQHAELDSTEKVFSPVIKIIKTLAVLIGSQSLLLLLLLLSGGEKIILIVRLYREAWVFSPSWPSSLLEAAGRGLLESRSQSGGFLFFFPIHQLQQTNLVFHL